MTDTGDAIQSVIERINQTIVSRPGAVVVAFLLLTAVFAVGSTAVETQQEATGAFTDDLPEQEALDDVEAEFGGSFSEDDRTTQLIQDGNDVLTKEALLGSLRLLERIEARDDLRVADANGPATVLASTLDPGAETATEQRRAIERASPAEIRRTVRRLAENPRFEQTVSSDFNPESASASASITVITHETPPEFDDDDLATIQGSIDTLATQEPIDVSVFGTGIVDEELASIIVDSLSIVMPIVVVLLLVFLVVAYRDPIDLGLGLLALLMTIIWTFGFLGYTGIPFDQQMIAVPVLLLAVGVDFGIHIINRYREETVQGYEPVPAMQTATDQLAVAFVIVTVTTVFGFGANIVSELDPIRNFGIASSVGIIFTFLIFGLFLPAAKLRVTRLRDRYGIPAFNSTPIASEESSLGRLLSVSATAGQRAPVVLVCVLLLFGGGMGVYGAGVDTTFEQDDFLPPEEAAWYVEYIPEPLAPDEYTVTETFNLLEDRFDASQDQSVILFVEGPMTEAHSLRALSELNDDPPPSLAVGENRRADTESILTVMDAHAERDPEFAALLERNDRDGDGVPDRNLDRIYDELFASAAAPRAKDFLTEDRSAAKIEYAFDAGATQAEVSADAAALADETRFDATATGEVIVFAAISNVIFQSAIQGLVLALVLTAVFLVAAYGVLNGRPWLGVVNVFPILIAVAVLLGTMRLLGLPLNALTATILSVSIGIGIAYSVHVTARFVDEFEAGADTLAALRTTLSGTGGALAGSMLTTSLGTGALAFAITPVLGNFGLLMAISVFYSFVGAVVALPPALFVWERLTAPGSESPGGWLPTGD